MPKYVSSCLPTLLYYCRESYLYDHLQPKLSDNDFLNSALKKAYMKGFSALLQYKRMIDECLIRIGTFKMESIKRMTTNGVQENRKAHVTITNVLNIFFSCFILLLVDLWLPFAVSCLDSVLTVSA